MVSNRFEEQARERRERADGFRDEYLDDDVPAQIAASLFSHAWDQGHAYGWTEVENHYADLATLVNMAYRAGVARD